MLRLVVPKRFEPTARQYRAQRSNQYTNPPLVVLPRVERTEPYVSHNKFHSVPSCIELMDFGGSGDWFECSKLI